MHYFNYTELTGDEELDNLDIHDYFLNRWCCFIQYKLLNKLEGSIPYQSFEKNVYTCDEYSLTHAFVKYKNYFIDVDGIFTEEEFIEKCQRHYKKMQLKNKKKRLMMNINSLEEWTYVKLYLEEVIHYSQTMRNGWIECYEHDSLMFRASEYVINQIMKDEKMIELIKK